MSTREAFEKWYDLSSIVMVKFERKDLSYVDPCQALAWEAWQAAMESKDTYDKLEIAIQNAKVSTNPFEFLCNQINAMKNTEFSVKPKEKL